MILRYSLLLLLVGCAPKGKVETGLASWYGPGFAGKPTASGVRFRPSRRTAAHRTLPFGTVLRVTRVDTGKKVRVVVNDRGPFVSGRILDVSQRAARKLGMIRSGVVEVKIEVVGCKRRYKRCVR